MGRGLPDTVTVATALAARTESFEPLIAIRPGYRRPAHFASAVATLDHLSGGRVRITIVVGDTTEQAWADAEVWTVELSKSNAAEPESQRTPAVGQQRLYDLATRGDVLDGNLCAAPGRVGGGGAGSTWLVGSAHDVAQSLRKYQDLGITHFSGWSSCQRHTRPSAVTAAAKTVVRMTGTVGWTR